MCVCKSVLWSIMGVTVYHKVKAGKQAGVEKYTLYARHATDTPHIACDIRQ